MYMESVTDYKKHIGSAVMTFLIASLLFFSGPASAMNININGLGGTHRDGQDIRFSIVVEVNHPPSGELVDIRYANLTLTFPNGTKETCKILNNETVEGCDFLSVRNIDVTGEDNYGYGYESVTFNGTSYGLGYGYGYGYGNKNTHVKYELTLDSSAFPPGTFSAGAAVSVGASPKIFSSRTAKFRIFAKKVPPGKEKKHKPATESEDDEDEDSAELEASSDGGHSGGPTVATAGNSEGGKHKWKWPWSGIKWFGNKSHNSEDD